MLVAQYSKTEKQVVSRRKDSFFEEMGPPGEEVDSCPKDQPPPADQSPEGEFLGCTWEGGGYMQNSSHPKSRLRVAPVRSHSVILVVLSAVCSWFPFP